MTVSDTDAARLNPVAAGLPPARNPEEHEMTTRSAERTERAAVDGPGCLEVATFRALAKVDRVAVVRALASFQGWLAAQPGFLRRRLAHDPASDTWVDTVEWRSLEDARRATEAYPHTPEAVELGLVVDGTTLRCFHATPVPLADAVGT